MAEFKSLLTPENSIILGAATVAVVGGIYQLDIGPVSQVHASDAYHPSNDSGIKKAGATALIAVSAIALMARDPNIVILGGAAIILFHAHYRHANAVNPGTGKMETRGSDAYQNTGADGGPPVLSAVA